MNISILNNLRIEKAVKHLLIAYILYRIPGMGKRKSMFIFQGEADIFLKSTNDPGAFLHPFILVPLCGQIMLLVTIFQKRPGRVLSLAALACLGSLMLFLLFIGLITPSIKIAGSTIPFLVTGIFVLRYNRKKKP